MTDKATPRPWVMHDGAHDFPTICKSTSETPHGTGTCHILFESDGPRNENRANCEYAVLAVNSHDKLVEAVQRFVDLDGVRIGTAGPEELRIAMLWARDALALARKEPTK